MDVAADLAEGATEAHRRTAASRAYYALLLEASELLVRWGVPVQHGKAHRDVRLTLLYSADPGLKDVAGALEWLSKTRNAADYELSDPGRRFIPAGVVVKKAIQDARQAIAVLDEIKHDDARRAAAIASLKPQ